MLPFIVMSPAKVALFLLLSNTNMFDVPPFHWAPISMSPVISACAEKLLPPENISTLPFELLVAPPLVPPDKLI